MKRCNHPVFENPRSRNNSSHHCNSLRHSENHKWFYYPEMEKEEVLLFKVYDKKEDGPRFVFHTAFSDPRTPANALPRRSVEIRAIAFFGE